MLGYIGEHGPSAPDDHAFIVTNSRSVVILPTGVEHDTATTNSGGRAGDKRVGGDGNGNGGNGGGGGGDESGGSGEPTFIKVIGQLGRLEELEMLMGCGQDFEDVTELLDFVDWNGADQNGVGSGSEGRHNEL